MTSQAELNAGMKIVRAVYEAIQESGDGIASGHLYAMMMGVVTLGSYQSIISLLVRNGLITSRFDWLKVAA